jgi:ABC-type Co2+ transport system permease subunit
VFAIAWAIALLATGVWAVRRNKRWVVNLLAVFGAIHFYTQYFERLGASPGSILVGGVMALLIALAIAKYNRT